MKTSCHLRLFAVMGRLLPYAQAADGFNTFLSPKGGEETRLSYISQGCFEGQDCELTFHWDEERLIEGFEADNVEKAMRVPELVARLEKSGESEIAVTETLNPLKA